MKKITLSLAAAVLATGIAASASAATAPATAPGLGIDLGQKVETNRVAVPGTQQAGYFYRYRCYYVRYGYRVYRRCFVRYYYN